MKNILQEFKAFAMRGSVIDLAVGIVIGGAFTTIVNSLVGDILMPVVGVITGGLDFSGLSYTLGGATIAYGKFIQATLSFLIVAFALFVVVRVINRLRHKEAATEKAKGPAEDIKLLTEIRDLLKK